MAILGAVAMMSIWLAAPTSASHDHYLDTPGICVQDIARGQTAKGPGEGGYHKFHENVHWGVSGDKAVANNDRISMGGGSCP